MRRPLATGSVALVLGMAGGLAWGHDWGPPIAILAILVVLKSALRQGSIHHLILFAGALLVGWIWATPFGLEQRRGSSYLDSKAQTRQTVRVSGRIMGNVAQRPADQNETRYYFLLTDIRVEDKNQHYRLPQTILSVIWYGPPPPPEGLSLEDLPEGLSLEDISPGEVRATASADPKGLSLPASGDRWRLWGRLHPISSRVGRAGRMDTARYRMVSRSRWSARLVTKAAPWRQRLERYRQHAARLLALGVDPASDELRLVQAMMLGYRSDIPRPLNRAFRTSGTIHVFAISGLHVMVIATILALMAARLGVPRNLWVLPVVPALTIYIIATGAQPSAMRAGLMASLYLLAPFLGRRPDSYTILGASAAALLMANPLQLYNPGFVLSFMLVLGLIIMVGPVTRALKRILRVVSLSEHINLRYGHWSADRLHGRLAYGGLHLLEKTVDLLGVSLAAWLTSIPLSSYYFGICPLYSLLANLFVVPLASLLMMSASTSLMLSFVALPLTALCNKAVIFIARVMKLVSVEIASWPGSTIEYRMPTIVMVVWYTVVWGGVLMAQRWRARHQGATWMGLNETGRG